jgi:hypothetical protein
VSRRSIASWQIYSWTIVGVARCWLDATPTLDESPGKTQESGECAQCADEVILGRANPDHNVQLAETTR